MRDVDLRPLTMEMSAQRLDTKAGFEVSREEGCRKLMVTGARFRLSAYRKIMVCETINVRG